LHIGFVTTESPYGDRGACGVAAYLRAIIPALGDGGHRITVFANSKQNESFAAEEGRVRVHHFRLPSTHWYAAKIPLLRTTTTLPLRQLEWSAAFYRRVARVAAREKIDVLESTELGSMFLGRIAPLVIRLHGSEFAFRKHAGTRTDLSVRWNDLLERYSSDRAAAITAPSRFQAEEITSHRGWPKDRVRVIPNPVSANMVKAALEFERNGSAEMIVLYSGRLAPVKGIETLLAAAKLVRDRNQAITFVLAGPWQMPRPPKSYGLELNRTSADGVRWIGPQDQSELIDWYKRAALFVMPSYFESFGISVVEAMAFGLPVVCTRAGAITENVDDGVTGLLVEPGDAVQLANRILQLVSDTQLRRVLGRAAQTKKIEAFSPALVTRANLAVYEEARSSFSAKAAK
jgi:glycosyltransferase involved in cell wall biosynthesis